MREVDGWLQKCYALDPSEREVTRKVFARIQAGEEQAARGMAAMAKHGSGDIGPVELNEALTARMKAGATTRGECDHAGGNWAGAYGCN